MFSIKGSKNVEVSSQQPSRYQTSFHSNLFPHLAQHLLIIYNVATNRAVFNMDCTHDKDLQLFYLSALFGAVNDSCRKMHNVTYSSGDSRRDRILSPFQSFLCKLAQVCDTEKGGDTVTALVALKAANGPGYLFASNNRKEQELESTRKFLGALLNFVGRKPENLTEKTLKKQVLGRILEFNFSRVGFYLKRILAFVGKCIASSHSLATHGGPEIVARLRLIEANATFPHDMPSDTSARLKFLKDCVSLIKTIQDAMAPGSGFILAMNEGAGADDPDTSYAWCQLRHHLGRLYSYRQAADSIVAAHKERPELFTGFTVGHIPSSRPRKLSLPKESLSLEDVILVAFPDRNVMAYNSQIEQLRDYGLDDHIRERLEQKPVRQTVHCEVHLQDFLVRGKMVEPHDYWDNDMFIATSKPPCRLCEYYFDDLEHDFAVQSPHMNVYPKWRLPDVYEGQDGGAVMRREELLDVIIGHMQQDTLRVVEKHHPEWKRNDSRTESWVGESRQGERSDTRTSGRFPSASGTGGQGMEAERRGFPFQMQMPVEVENEYVCVGSAS
ncbi:uncharacterized protein LY79DRAFT_545253 [Colletotrichum navitas]|uniref:Uncharacterized protein n=1 Tax=Colletotrichum navitas TaxID=681940 RepID=A0AAD8V7P6_9PEZI|nr:uncharacterized protein LY79DRAFT_545253 [Colletotrichum navitas]KAK1596074.1 hypothetical protein LY79DRAFT_545253 [Colletotrichum navitas]